MKPNLAEFTEQFGLILFVEKFDECEKFYAETIGLRILYRKESLTAFEFGNGYRLSQGRGAPSTSHYQSPFDAHLSLLTNH
jgi:lactoylglutathione lyase